MHFRIDDGGFVKVSEHGHQPKLHVLHIWTGMVVRYVYSGKTTAQLLGMQLYLETKFGDQPNVAFWSINAYPVNNRLNLPNRMNHLVYSLYVPKLSARNYDAQNKMLMLLVDLMVTGHLCES